MNNTSCYVRGCDYQQNTSFHRLPANKDVAKYLLKGLGFAEDFLPSSSFRICRNHFTDDSVINTNGKFRLASRPKLRGHESDFSDDDPVGFFEEFKQQLSVRIPNEWKVLDKGEYVYFYLEEFSDDRKIPTIDKTIVVHRSKRISAFYKRRKVQIDRRVSRVGGKVTIVKWSDLKVAMQCLGSGSKILKNKKSELNGIEELTMKRPTNVYVANIAQRKKNSESSCRVCLKIDKRDLLDMHGASQENEESFAKMIQFCSGIEIKKDDKLPQKICTNCTTKVESACETKRLCIASDDLLRTKIKDEIVDDIEAAIQEFEVNMSDLGGGFQLTEVFKSEERSEFGEDDDRDDYSFQESDEHEPAPRMKKPKPENFVCVFCDQTFKMVKLKDEHVKAEHPDERVCKICHIKRPTLKSTENCIRDHLFGLSHLCQVCGKNFRSATRLRIHSISVHETSEAVLCICDFCGFKTRHKGNVRRHIISMHLRGAKKFACPHCPDVSYTTHTSLNLHLYRQHEVEAPIKCNYCNAGFSYSLQLRAHRVHCSGSLVSRGKKKSLREHFDIKDGKFQCKLCPRSYDSRQKYSFHYQSTHKDNKTCKICNKTFNMFVNYRRHLRNVHEKIRKYHCEHPGCGKSFGTNGILKSHKNTHTGEKPFRCNRCDFKTGDEPTLSKHRRTHSNVKKTKTS